LLAKAAGNFHIKKPMDLKTYWRTRQKQVEQALDRSLPKASARPATIHRAMRYSLFAGGKRLRPILCLAANETLGGRPEDALPAACAVECIHTYSLIHDDLPCMDDDDLRRGKPTSHKVFGEGIAVLAGDALLTHAFAVLAGAKARPRYSIAAMSAELAAASGSRALIAGQVVDLENEGKKITPSELQYIHRMKTAALITSSLRLGAMSANATPAQLKTLTDYGQALGLAFQVIDDILDITQTSEQLGKSSGKDLKAQKATYPSILGMEKARREAARLTQKAGRLLETFGQKGEILREINHYMLRRQN
jgi:geranylgeranyl diphosphate synthase type II